jgi:Family of unknown function (DUF6585)
MLGPEVETFGGNRATMLVWALIVAVLGLWFYWGLNLNPRQEKIYLGILAGIIALILGLLNSIRLTLHTDGVSYQSWLRNKEMRWDALERFYFSSVKRSWNFIPMGTYYQFKFEDAEGNKLKFGNRVGRLRELSGKLADASFPSLYKKSAEKFNRGEEVDFGDVKISKAGGIKIKRTAYAGFGTKFVEIPWNEIHAYEIQKGHFYVWRPNEKRTTGPMLSNVPNAFVLKGLLDSIFKAPPPAVELK